MPKSPRSHKHKKKKHHGKGYSSGSDDEVARPQRGVPRFDGDRTKYRAYRLRAELYRNRALRRGVESQEYKTWMDDLLTGLTGTAWDTVEPLATLDLSAKHVQERFWKLLDEAFQYDPRTEIIARFEEFLFKYKRGRKETLHEYDQAFAKAYRKFTEIKVKIQADGEDVEESCTLPIYVLGYLYLRKSRISQQQKTSVLTGCQHNLSLRKLQEQMLAF